MLKRAILTGLASLVLGLPCAAQLDTGVLLGTVVDPSGAVIPSAEGVVQNQGTGASQTIHTDNTGSFIAPALPVGLYRVTVSAAGFKKRVTENVRLQVSDRRRLDFALETGEVSQQITVDATPPLVDTASTT